MHKATPLPANAAVAIRISVELFSVAVSDAANECNQPVKSARCTRKLLRQHDRGVKFRLQSAAVTTFWGCSKLSQEFTLI
jgi:hypothetical protein